MHCASACIPASLLRIASIQYTRLLPHFHSAPIHLLRSCMFASFQRVHALVLYSRIQDCFHTSPSPAPTLPFCIHTIATLLHVHIIPACSLLWHCIPAYSPIIPPSRRGLHADPPSPPSSIVDTGEGWMGTKIERMRIN